MAPVCDQGCDEGWYEGWYEGWDEGWDEQGQEAQIMLAHTRTTPPTRTINCRSANGRSAFTIVEVLVVSGIIALLIALLVPALTGGRQTANMAKSQTRLKQVFTWMQAYSSENREHIVPSQFDYTVSAATYAVKVRSDPTPAIGDQFKGTWTDILWTFGGMGANQALIDENDPTNLDKYVYDSPDIAAYESDPDFESPFRSSESNSRAYGPGDGTPLPFGAGATESATPGYFAANNFFNATPGLPANAFQPAAGPGGRWYVTGQIKAPDRSMYVVDSLAGETIEPDDASPGGPWANPTLNPTGSPDLQVDFRYNGACLMLFLDGHSKAEAPWLDLGDLEISRKIKVQNLTQN